MGYRRERDIAQQLREESLRQHYFVEMDLAGRLLNESGGIGRIEEIVARWDGEHESEGNLQGWEWYYLNSRLNRHVYELQLETTPYCACFSPDGKWVAFGDEVGSVRICPTSEMSRVTELGRHNSVVRAVSWSSDGRYLASGSVDQKVFVYDMDSNDHIYTFSHDEHVISVEWHPNAPILASSSNDGVVKVWQVNEERLDSEFDIGTGAQSLAWKHDGKQLAVGTWASTVRIWDFKTKEFAEDLTGFSSVLNAIDWNRNGKVIAVGEDNGELSIRNMARESSSRNLTTRRLIRDLAWSPDSSSIAVVGKDRSIKIWNRLLSVLIRDIEGHRGTVWSVDWSSDGEQLLTASEDYKLKVWRANDPSDDRNLSIPSGAPVYSLDWKPDDTQIVVGTDLPEALIFDVRTGKLKKRLDAGYSARLQTVAWSPDGRQVASGGWDERIVIWDADNGEKITEYKHVSEKPDDGIPNIVNCVSWNRDGTKVASTCYDSSIFVWDPKNGETINSYTVDRGNVYWVDWHPVKPNLIAASTSIHGDWIWTVDGQKPTTIDTAKSQSRCIRWNPDGSRFAICRDDGMVTIHDANSFELQLSLRNHLGQVFHVDWSPDGGRLATASEDGTVRVWDAVTGTQTISFDRFQGPVACVSWSHDGRSLAAAGKRGIVHILNATTGYERSKQLFHE